MKSKLVVAIAFGSVFALAQAAQAQVVTPEPPQPAENVTIPSLSFEAGDHLSSDIVGQTVYSGTTAEATTIGEINNLVVNEDGSVIAAVIGVGGFLGVGEKNVAVAFESLEWHVDDTGGQFAVLMTTREQLENAPALDMAAIQPAERTAPPAGPGVPSDVADLPSAPSIPPSEPGAADVPTDVAALPSDAGDPGMKVLMASEFIGTSIVTADNETVGSINDVLLTEDGRIDAVIVDIGGFLGLGAKPVAIGFEALTLQAGENDSLIAHVDLTKAQLELATGYAASDYQAQRQTMRLSLRG